MTRDLRCALTVPVAGWILLHITGCSFIGFSVGAILDASVPDADILSPAELESLKPGEAIEVMRTDSTVLSGDYAGLDTRADKHYAEKYAEQVTGSPIGRLMPSPGDTVHIVTHSARGRGEARGKVIGFSERAVCLQSQYYGGTVGVILDYIDTVYQAKGPFVTGDSLRQYVGGGKIPLMKSGLLLAGDRDTTFIPFDNISEVRTPNSHDGKWVGLAFGAICDGLIIFLWGEGIR